MHLISKSSNGIARTAAQYVRMSTDMQKYSTENQAAVIALYASARNIKIICTYADEGRSGLKVHDRPGLRQLLRDVRSGNVEFNTILVYDVSRWGRFQDADESAYYEFLCREAGISVQYCAEQFENDGSLMTTIVKNIKRAMAGEYSRELSTKVFVGKCNLVRKGFRHGGLAGFGLRRMLIDEHGEKRMELQQGQHKFLQTDRVVLVPGPADEIQHVRWIFERFNVGKASLSAIASELNKRDIKNGCGRPWSHATIRHLLSNEKYIGNNVFNRTSYKLKERLVRNPRGLWVRAEGAFEPIIDRAVFETAQWRLSSIRAGYSDFQLLDYLTALWCQHGRLSATLMGASPTCPSTTTYNSHFGSVLTAFKRLGYRKLRYRPTYANWRNAVAEEVIEAIRNCGGTVVREKFCEKTRFVVNDEIHVAVTVTRLSYTTRTGGRWILKQSPHCVADLIIVARLDEAANNIKDYLFLPRSAVDNFKMILNTHNHMKIDTFRSDSLAPLFSIFGRQKIISTAAGLHNSAIKTSGQDALSSKMPKIRHFRNRGRNVAAKSLLGAYERHSKKMSSFTSNCELINRSQSLLEHTIGVLLLDPQLRELFLDSGIDDLPAILAERIRGGGPRP